jgi:opacity protein-like surface antigen
VARLITLFALLAYGLPSMATDITLLAGYQFNTDFEINTFEKQPPEVDPDTGEPGDDVELDDSVAFSLAVDFVFNDNQNQRIGFYVSHAQSEFQDNAGLADRDIDVTHVHFTAMSYYPDGRFEPFVLAGVGAGFFNPKDSTLKDLTKFSAQIGGGANYKITENLLLRLDIRWIPTFFNGNSSGFCSGGCTIRISSDTYSQVQANVGLMFRF